MAKSILRSVLARFTFTGDNDLGDLYAAEPRSFSNEYPDVPVPDEPLTPSLLAAQWVGGDLHSEDMPGIAADLLEAGFDSPSLRRLAGEMQITCIADVEGLVGRTFHELGVKYPISEDEAKSVITRQIAREVIAGKRNPWAAASHLEIAIWGWRAISLDLEEVFMIHGEIDYEPQYRRPIAEIGRALVAAFSRLAAPADIGSPQM